MVKEEAIRSLLPCAFLLLSHTARSNYAPHIFSEIMLLYYGGMSCVRCFRDQRNLECALKSNADIHFSL